MSTVTHGRHGLATVWAIALTGLVAACGGDGTTVPEPVGAAGTWRLTEIGGRPMPVDIGTGSDCVTITQGSLTIRTDASYEDSVSLRACGTLNTSMTIAITGTWNQDGNLVDFVPAEGCGNRAVVTATSLRVARDCSLGVPVVYAR